MSPPPQDNHHFAGGGSAAVSASDDLKQTELTLGLPGSSDQINKKSVGLTLDLMPNKGFASAGAKRGFADAIDGVSRETGAALFSNAGTGAGAKGNVEDRAGKDKEKGPSKAQVVGWPPIKSSRKMTMAHSSSTKPPAKEEGGHAAQGGAYVKVSMDGAPYLRKVDLRVYAGYKDLSLALETMFSSFNNNSNNNNNNHHSDNCGGKEEIQSEMKTKDFLNKSEYVLTYEDKDGDWMLVGDVPWQMFIELCKKLRIMKGSDAIGLAPRAKNQN